MLQNTSVAIEIFTPTFDNPASRPATAQIDYDSIEFSDVSFFDIADDPFEVVAVNFDIGPGTISYEVLDFGGQFTPLDGGFNGYKLSFESFAAQTPYSIRDVLLLDDLTTLGLTADDVSFDADAVFVNAEGLQFARGDTAEFGVALRGIGDDSDDILQGFAFDDLLRGHDGADELHGLDGADTLDGGAGNDTLIGGTSSLDRRDVIYGGHGDDFIDGGYGNDQLNGSMGNDTIRGGFGGDTVIGNAGDDELSGQALGDVLFGGGGNDFLNGGFGFDRLNGGAGADEFYHLGIADHGSDWIQDFGADDTLVFGGDATIDQFQVNVAATAGAGAGDIGEAFVIFRPTGQVIWALVDGADNDQLNLALGFAGDTFELAV